MQQTQSQFYLEGQIFADLSNPVRLQILMILEEKPITVSLIAKKLKTTIQNIQRHLTRLINSELIEKTNDGTISLTTLGMVSLIHLPSIRFISRNKGFFSSHDFGDIPLNLKWRIGELLDSKTSKSIASTFSYIEKIVKESKDYLKCILTHPPILVGDLMKNQLENDNNISILFGKNSIIPQNSKLIEILELKTRTTYPNLKKRLAEKVGLNLIMNEKTALLMFTHKGGEADWFNSIISTDSKFHNWCQEFFDYKWNCAEPIGRLR